MHRDFDIRQFEQWESAYEFAKAFHGSSNFAYAYAFATFLTISGHILGRRVSLWHRIRLYPNWYTCLVGPSGIAHKSTIMNYGIETIPPNVSVLTSLATVQGLLARLLEGGGKALVSLDELATLMSTSKKDYARELIQFLTEVYGCPTSVSNNTARTRVTVPEPVVSILSGSTSEWLQQTISSSDLLGGFGNRMTFVLGDPRPDNNDPLPPNYGAVDWTFLGDAEGDYELEQGAREVWEEFAIRFNERQMRATPFERVLAERVPDKVLKTALILAVWEDMPIDYDILVSAIEWGWYLYDCVSELAPAFESIDRQLLLAIKNGGNTNTRLFDRLGHLFTAKQIKDSLQHLQWAGKVSHESGKYRLDTSVEE